jgi:hypothetical protein
MNRLIALPLGAYWVWGCGAEVVQAPEPEVVEARPVVQHVPVTAVASVPRTPFLLHAEVEEVNLEAVSKRQESLDGRASEQFLPIHLQCGSYLLCPKPLLFRLHERHDLLKGLRDLLE